MIFVTTNPFFVMHDTRDTVAAGQCPHCRLRIPFPTVARLHQPRLVYCRVWRLYLVCAYWY